MMYSRSEAWVESTAAVSTASVLMRRRIHACDMRRRIPKP
jgi:hypothetical protein